MNKKKIYIVILILVLVLSLSASALASGCNLLVTEDDTGEPEEEEEVAEEEVAEEEDMEYHIAYFQVGSEEASMHFEHRVAKIIAISPDGNGEKVIYTDLNEKYDLSRIYSVSPDSSKISWG